MRPLQQFNLHAPNNMNFRKDVILDLISRTEKCTVSEILDACSYLRLGSQATIHRELQEIIGSKFIKTSLCRKDGRIRYLRASALGKRYIERL